MSPTFFNNLQVTGAVVNIRSGGDKLGVWLVDSKQTVAVLKIGKMIKEKLGVGKERNITYHIHKEQIGKGKRGFKFYL